MGVLKHYFLILFCNASSPLDIYKGWPRQKGLHFCLLCHFLSLIKTSVVSSQIRKYSLTLIYHFSISSVYMHHSYTMSKPCQNTMLYTLNHPPIYSLHCFPYEKLPMIICADKYLTFSKAYNIVEKMCKNKNLIFTS